MFGALLDNLGQDVRVVYDSDSALRIAREHRPHIAFLDVSMPGVSGAELAASIRDDSPGGPPLIVAVTGLDREQLERAGAAFDRHLLKPAPVSEVVDILNDPQIVVAE